MKDLAGRVALVTGSATGLGREIVIRLAERGADVIINYSRSAAEAEDTADMCREHGSQAEIVKANVAEPEDCKVLAEAAARRGRLDILGNRLDLDSAQITLQGSLIPFLNIRAATSVDDTDVNVEVFGPADNPELTFSSSPELPQEEVLALLIFGRDLESLSALQAARLAIAVRTLAGRGGEGLVEDIRGSTGLADLDVTTDEDGNAAVRAGGYLTENVYTDVTVDSEGDTQLNLNLDVTPSLTVRGGVTNDGDSSIGIFFERDY